VSCTHNGFLSILPLVHCSIAACTGRDDSAPLTLTISWIGYQKPRRVIPLFSIFGIWSRRCIKQTGQKWSLTRFAQVQQATTARYKKNSCVVVVEAHKNSTLSLTEWSLALQVSSLISGTDVKRSTSIRTARSVFAVQCHGFSVRMYRYHIMHRYTADWKLSKNSDDMHEGHKLY